MNRPETDKLTITVQNNLLTLLDDDGCGWQNLAFGLRTQEGTEVLAIEESAGGADETTLRGTYPQSGLAETVTLRHRPGCAVVLERRIENPTAQTATVREALLGSLGGSAGRPAPGAKPRNLRFCHLDNLRTERFPWCRPETQPYVGNVPLEPRWFGDQESQALPAALHTDQDYERTLVEGQLAQEWSRLRWRLAAHPRAELYREYCLGWQAVGGSLLLAAGETLSPEPLFLQRLLKTHPQDALADYFVALRERNELRQEQNVLHRKAFYCSWNYGVMRNISEESLLRTARCIHEKLPGISHFLIDGGWQGREAVDTPDCSNFYLPSDQWHDASRFPNGMGVMAEKLREAGVKPAIWWTPSVSLSSTLAREHPEWLAQQADGTPFRIRNSGALDYSVPAAREYLNRVFEIIFKEWGYEAMKMDFWSQTVESNRIRFRTGTGMQWRDWLLSTIRSYLPEDGFLMTCVATAHGNVLLGRHAHTYRCCIDVGNCSWLQHKDASCWVQPLLSYPGRETCLLNIDGLGVNQKLSDEENLHRLTYGFITMGSLEIDGRLEELPEKPLGWIRRLTETIDRGYVVRCPDGRAYTGEPFPEVLYVDYPAESPTRNRGVAKHVALLNWSDEPRYLGATAAQLGLDGAVEARNFWTDETRAIPAEGLCELLPGRAARLYEIPVA